jgi:hypothetical protein
MHRPKLNTRNGRPPYFDNGMASPPKDKKEISIEGKMNMMYCSPTV